ncbi:hypothetical protein AVEN_2613-1, partial [Araneus ventricosus]
MDAEMHNMKTRKVWSLVPAPPKEVKVVGCRWVYNLKKNNEVSIQSRSRPLERFDEIIG